MLTLRRMSRSISKSQGNIGSTCYALFSPTCSQTRTAGSALAAAPCSSQSLEVDDNYHRFRDVAFPADLLAPPIHPLDSKVPSAPCALVPTSRSSPGISDPLWVARWQPRPAFPVNSVQLTALREARQQEDGRVGDDLLVNVEADVILESLEDLRSFHRSESASRSTGRTRADSRVGPVDQTATRASPGVRQSPVGKKQWRRTFDEVLGIGMRPGMVPSVRKPMASIFLLEGESKEAAALQAEVCKLWRRRGLGNNKVLSGPTWSMRRLKLARQEATKMERERERALAKSGSRGSGLGAAEFCPTDTQGLGAVLRILEVLRGCTSAGKVSEWAEQQQWVVPDGRVYAELARICAWAGDTAAAEELLRDMWRHEIGVDSATLFLVLAAFAKSDRLEEALQLYGDSQCATSPPHEATLALMVWAHSQCGRAADALHLAAAIEASCWIPDPGSAESAVRELATGGAPPEVAIIAAALRGLRAHRGRYDYEARVESYRQMGQTDRAAEWETYLITACKHPPGAYQRIVEQVVLQKAAAAWGERKLDCKYVHLVEAFGC